MLDTLCRAKHRDKRKSGQRNKNGGRTSQKEGLGGVACRVVRTARSAVILRRLRSTLDLGVQRAKHEVKCTQTASHDDICKDNSQDHASLEELRFCSANTSDEEHHSDCLDELIFVPAQQEQDNTMSSPAPITPRDKYINCLGLPWSFDDSSNTRRHANHRGNGKPEMMM